MKNDGCDVFVLRWATCGNAAAYIVNVGTTWKNANTATQSRLRWSSSIYLLFREIPTSTCLVCKSTSSRQHFPASNKQKARVNRMFRGGSRIMRTWCVSWADKSPSSRRRPTRGDPSGLSTGVLEWLETERRNKQKIFKIKHSPTRYCVLTLLEWTCVELKSELALTGESNLLKAGELALCCKPPCNPPENFGTNSDALGSNPLNC